MSGADDIAGDGTVGQFAERLRDEYGIELGDDLAESGDSLQDVLENAQHDAITGHHDSGQGHGGGGHGGSGHGAELQTGQTIHGEDDWEGKAVDSAGVMLDGEFVATGDWSGGVLEDDEKPPEHVVYTEGEQPKGEKADSWVDEGAAYGEGFDEGYDTGFDEGYDQAWEDWSEEFGDSGN